tara:strand:+ start:342 stop:659 length:318 start_codon:yes stop_codon:yes gene_type:complete
MAVEKQLNPCPACQGNGKFRYFTNVHEDKAQYTICTMCNGQEHLSDDHYKQFSQAELDQMETRWEHNHKPISHYVTLKNPAVRTGKTLSIGLIYKQLTEQLQGRK